MPAIINRQASFLLMFLGITNIYAFTLATFVVVLSPGPNTLYVTALTLRHGLWHGVFGMLGVFVGDCTLMLLAALGGSTLLLIYPNFFNAIRLAGALYLGWVGIGLIYLGVKNWNNVLFVAKEIDATKKIAPASLAFYKTLMVSLLNPKAILFFLTFFLQFIDPNYPNRLTPFLVQAGIVELISVIYLSTLVLVGARAAHGLKNKAQWQSLLQVVIGGVLCMFSLFIWRDLFLAIN